MGDNNVRDDLSCINQTSLQEERWQVSIGAYETCIVTDEIITRLLITAPRVARSMTTQPHFPVSKPAAFLPAADTLATTPRQHTGRLQTSLCCDAMFMLVTNTSVSNYQNHIVNLQTKIFLQFGGTQNSPAVCSDHHI